MDAFTIPQVAELSGLTSREVRLWIEHGNLRPLPGVWPRRVTRAEVERSGIVHQGEVLAEPVEEKDSLANELRALRERLAEADAQAARALIRLTGDRKGDGRFGREGEEATVVRPALFQLFASSDEPDGD
jgi:hypothetical protein